MPDVRFNYYLLIIIVTILLSQSCGQNHSENGDEKYSGKVIVGGLDWVDVKAISPDSLPYQNSKKIAYLDIPAVGARCTAFLISSDIIMTNQHCITESLDAMGAVARFNHLSGTDSANYQSFSCSEFIGNNSELDFALLRCKGRPGDIYGYVTLDESGIQTVGQKLYVIQQNCDYYTVRNCDPSKKIAYGNVLSFASEYAHNADTLGGSSGSPVFDFGNNKVFALHHVGVGNDGNGRGVENRAVPMSRIVPELRRSFPGILTANPSNGPSDFEPNNTFQTAALIDLSHKLTGLFEIKSNDLDYYQIKLEKKSRFHASIGFWHKYGDLDLKLFDQNQNLVGVSEGVVDFETISLELEAGEYTVLVYGYQGAVTAYNLLLQLY